MTTPENGAPKTCRACFGVGTVAGGFRCPVCTLEELRKARESTAEDYGECAECERPLTAEDTEFCEACDRADYEASQAARAAKA